MSFQGRVSRPFRLLSIATLMFGGVALIVSWGTFPPRFTAELALLLVAAMLSENFAFSLPAFSVSLSYPLTMGAIVLAGPAAAGAVAVVCSTNYEELRAHRPTSVVLFNLGQLVFITTVGAWVYVLLGGRVLATPTGGYAALSSADFPHILVPMLATAGVCALGNMLITSFGVSLLQGISFRRLLESMAAFAPTQVAMAFVGYLLAQVMAINLWALPLFVFPLVVARQLYQRYTTLRAAYGDTVRSLVGALEAKDPYTRGHSERVAEYAVAIGTALGVDERVREQLEYAALLHDLGKLSIPAAVLTKPRRLSSEEYQAMQMHPAVGESMVLRVPPLKELAEFIRHHHERWDGEGYPDGVAGEHIPLLARILTVADSYDAMTTNRAYRRAMSHKEACEQLEECSGSQFDPDVVARFLSSEVRATMTDIDRVSATGPEEP